MPSLEPIDYSDIKGFCEIKATIFGKSGIWKGQVQNGLPHGKGALFYVDKNGKWFIEGKCLNGEFNGQSKHVSIHR